MTKVHESYDKLEVEKRLLVEWHAHIKYQISQSKFELQNLRSLQQNHEQIDRQNKLKIDFLEKELDTKEEQI